MLTEDPPLMLIIVVAIGAAAVLFMLYQTLGKRVGRQPGDAGTDLDKYRPRDPSAPKAERPAVELGEAATGAAAIRQRDPNFEPTEFLEGARTAYTTIVRAFSAGDRDALRPLLAAPVMSSFEAVIAQRESEGRSESVEFLHPPRADLDQLELEGNTARARVRFLGELRTRSKGPEGEAVDDRRTAEIWTFERDVTSSDPNWSLARVEAAEA
ncbi:MAG TPA: TIM44-related membrane protein TimA [Caulobacteraceae bacterium]|nr:TIM44-related membrane protein TimA [Caulobacteraceae bacterium]